MTSAAWFVRTHLIVLWHVDWSVVDSGSVALVWFRESHPLGRLIRVLGVG